MCTLLIPFKIIITFVLVEWFLSIDPLAFIFQLYFDTTSQKENTSKETFCELCLVEKLIRCLQFITFSVSFLLFFATFFPLAFQNLIIN